MTETSYRTRQQYYTDLRERLAEARTHIEWITSGAAPAANTEEELIRVASSIWDCERSLEAAASQFGRKIQNRAPETVTPEFKRPAHVAAPPLGKPMDARVSSHSHLKLINGVA